MGIDSRASLPPLIVSSSTCLPCVPTANRRSPAVLASLTRRPAGQAMTFCVSRSSAPLSISAHRSLTSERPLRGAGALCDVGPTIVRLLGLERPDEMTGTDLRELETAGARS